MSEKVYMRHTIGVVLCTYNGERYVRTQLESILAQSRKPDILLACDDASHDGTIGELEACAELAPFHFRIVRNNENLGYVRNFEQAIRRCDADIIVLSDQDDWWRQDKLEVIETIFAEYEGVAALFSDASIIDENLNDCGYTLLDALKIDSAQRRDAQSGHVFSLLLRYNVVCGATLALRAKWKSIVFPIPEGAYHDEWIGLVAAAHGALQFIPSPLIRYRQHSENQIGLRRVQWRQRIRKLFDSQRPESERLLALMRALRQRLTNTGAPAAAVHHVEAKMAHLHRRLSFPSSWVTRARVVLEENAHGQYARYSSGWRSAVRDFVLPM